MLKMMNSGGPSNNGYERRIYYQTTTSSKEEKEIRKKTREYEDQEQEEKVFTSEEMETPFVGNHYPVRTPLGNGGPQQPPYVTRISQGGMLYDKRPMAPMDYDTRHQMTYDQTDATTDRDSTAPSLANAPLPPTPRNGKYRELENQWGLKQGSYLGYGRDSNGGKNGYLVESEGGGKGDLTPRGVGVLFIAAAFILFFMNCIPVLVGRWNILYQLEFESTFYSAQFVYYILLVAGGVSIWTGHAIQSALMGACFTTILAIRLPSVVVGIHGAVSLLGFHTGTYAPGSVVDGTVINAQINPQERSDYVPPIHSLIGVLIIEGIIDLILLAAALVCFCVYRNYKIPPTGVLLTVLAGFAAFADIYPKLHFIIETARTVDPNDQGYYSGFGANTNNLAGVNQFGSSNLILGNNGIQTGGLLGGLAYYQGSRAACRSVFSPVPSTIWQNSIGEVSPYIFTILVVFLALAPTQKKYSESYGWLVRTTTTVCIAVLVVAQIAMLISRSYTIHKIRDPLDYIYKQGPRPSLGDCIEGLIWAMIVCRVIVLVLCFAIAGLLIVHERRRNRKTVVYTVTK